LAVALKSDAAIFPHSGLETIFRNPNYSRDQMPELDLKRRPSRRTIHVAQRKEDVAMNTYDFAPLRRSTVGFDRLLDMINNPPTSEGYPPYDIARVGEDNYRISLAVAGFSQSDISITAQQNQLIVAGKKDRKAEGEILYQGISGRSFERRFSLADHVEVASASMENGLLQIDLVRRIPDAMKPRRIEIRTVPGAVSSVDGGEAPKLQQVA
jgi:molecular chaperone IbpA